MAGAGVDIGDCAEEEIGQIIAIERDAFPTPWSEDIFRREIVSPVSRVLVARLGRDPGRSVLGYAVYWRVVDEIHLHNIAVRHDWRRQGVGSLLLGEVARRSRAEGARWMTLEVRQRNAAAQRLYEKFGFSVRGIRPGYYTDTGEDALILWVDLCPDPAGESGFAGKGEGCDG